MSADNGALCYRRYVTGDDEGLVEIIRDYKDGLVLYLSSLTGDPVLAEECMEETFFRLAVRKPRFNGKSSFKTWLYAIARNTAVDDLRKRSHIAPVLPEDINSADDTDIEREYLREEQKIALHKAMRCLNPDYCQVLTLTYFEDFSIDETALIMKKSKKQVNNLLYRAKQSLRTILEKGGFVYEEL